MDSTQAMKVVDNFHSWIQSCDMRAPETNRVEISRSVVTVTIDKGGILIPSRELPNVVSEMPNIVVPHSTFGLLKKLPRELRLNIWRQTFQPRVITIRVESHGYISPSGKSRFPVALQICTESREEALRWYHLCFRAGPHPTYINPYIDIPHIRHGSKGLPVVTHVLPYPGFDFSSAFLGHLKFFFPEKFITVLRHLAIDRDLWVLRMGSAPLILRLFSRLEQLSVVIDDHILRDEYEWEDEDVRHDDSEEDEYDTYDSESEVQVEVLEVWDSPDGGAAAGKYHRRAEKARYKELRLKLSKSEWDYPHFFRESQRSLGYANFVKDDIAKKLNEGSDQGILQRRPEVIVVVEELGYR